jgi:ligand-binding sensor domain-containing protein
MHTRTFALTVLVLAVVSGNTICQTWNQMAHVGRVYPVRASDVEDLLVPAPGVYLAATDSGIFRSTDAGIHWSLPFTEGWGGGSLFSHPDGRIFAGTYKGLYVTTDMGVTWSLVSSHPPVMVCRMARDSQGRLFTALWGTGRATSGVCRSTDNGATWSKVLDLIYMETVEMLPGDVLLAGGYYGIHKSTDAGQTWTTLYDSVGVRSLIKTQSGPMLFGWYLVTPSLKMATYRSTDSGTTWNKVAGFYAEYFATDANNYVYVASDSGMRKTTDNGTTWQVLNMGLLNRNGAVPWLRTLTRISDNELIAGEYHTGELFRSTDLAAHWSTVSTIETVRATPANLSAIAFKRPDKLFLASARFGMEQWTEGGGLVYINSGLTDTSVRAVHVAENGDLFAGTAGGVFRSTNNGGTWSKFGTTTILTKALADLPNGALLTGTNSGVVKYVPDGSSFATMNTGLVSRSVNALWAGTDGRTFVGTEDGLYRLDSITWVPMSVSGGTLKVVHIAAFGQTLALAARDSGVYVSTDNGQLWQHKTAGMENLSVTGIVLTSQDQLYAATEQNGVFAATTGSTLWTAAAGGLNDLRLKALALGPGGYLYAASDSGALSRTSTPLVAVRDLPRTEPAKFVLDQNYPNPFNPTTSIGYTVAGTGQEALGTSWVKLSVYDMLGREVAVLVNERMQPGSYETRFDAGRLASGVYLFRLTAGNYIQTRSMLFLK